LLDSFSGSLAERSFYLACRKELSLLTKEKEEITAEVGSTSLLEQLTREVEEISQAELKPEEEEVLIARHRAAVHGKRLLELSALAAGRLNEDELSAASALAEATRSLRELARLDGRVEEDLQELEVISEKVQQLTQRLQDYNEALELDQNDQQQIEERLDLFTTLKRKYGNTLEEVLAHGFDVARRLELLSTGQERLAALDAKIEAAREKMVHAMNVLTQARNQGAKKLTAAIVGALSDLGFRQAGFEIVLEKLLEPAVDGGEQADFLFAPNPGEPLQPLRMIASSGEISRVMLALKSAMAFQDRIPLLVFDEIDANVGGEIASKVGAKMQELSHDHQVLCITHLPQVAAAATSQVVVQKEVHAGRTTTTLRAIEGEARVEEIARMLGGSSQSALAHAKALLTATTLSISNKRR
jgi:DNA repair protein RecN (Recombination protein N)